MIDATEPPRGSTAHQPDPDWSPTSKTVLILELAAAQTQAAMMDSSASVDVLTHSFTAMANYMQLIADTIQTLPDEGQTGVAKQRLSGVSADVSSQMNQAIIAFQFYDKLVQRLAHVGISLGDLGNLLGDTQRRFKPGEWVELQQKIKAKYSTREEVAMFEAVMRGMPAQQAVEAYLAEMGEKPDSIVLF